MELFGFLCMLKAASKLNSEMILINTLYALSILRILTGLSMVIIFSLTSVNTVRSETYLDCK